MSDEDGFSGKRKPAQLYLTASVNGVFRHTAQFQSTGAGSGFK